MAIIIKSRLPHSRGQMVAGVDGNLYRVDPDTMLLHRMIDGSVADEAGCEDDDAAEFLCFTEYSKPRAAAPASAEPAAASTSEPDSEPTISQPTPETDDDNDEDEAAAPAQDADLSVLDGSVSSLTAALSSGDHDDSLAELLAAEEAGKTRKTAVAAIQERMAQIL